MSNYCLILKHLYWKCECYVFWCQSPWECVLNTCVSHTCLHTTSSASMWLRSDSLSPLFNFPSKGVTWGHLTTPRFTFFLHYAPFSFCPWCFWQPAIPQQPFLSNPTPSGLLAILPLLFCNQSHGARTPLPLPVPSPSLSLSLGTAHPFLNRTENWPYGSVYYELWHISYLHCLIITQNTQILGFVGYYATTLCFHLWIKS